MLVLKSVYDIHPDILGVRVRLESKVCVCACVCPSVARIRSGRRVRALALTSQRRTKFSGTIAPSITYLPVESSTGSRQTRVGKKEKGRFQIGTQIWIFYCESDEEFFEKSARQWICEVVTLFESLFLPVSYICGSLKWAGVSQSAEGSPSIKKTAAPLREATRPNWSTKLSTSPASQRRRMATATAPPSTDPPPPQPPPPSPPMPMARKGPSREVQAPAAAAVQTTRKKKR